MLTTHFLFQNIHWKIFPLQSPLMNMLAATQRWIKTSLGRQDGNLFTLFTLFTACSLFKIIVLNFFRSSTSFVNQLQWKSSLRPAERCLEQAPHPSTLLTEKVRGGLGFFCCTSVSFCVWWRQRDYYRLHLWSTCILKNHMPLPQKMICFASVTRTVSLKWKTSSTPLNQTVFGVCRMAVFYGTDKQIVATAALVTPLSPPSWALEHFC